MAESSSVIELIFKGVDQTTDTVKTVSGSLGTLGGSVTAAAAPFANLADVILKTDTVLAAMAVTLGGVAVSEAAKFESSLLDLQKQLVEGEGQATEYAAELEKLALQYGVNANELVNSAADFKAAGYTIETSIQLVKQSLDLMIAGGVSAERATEILKTSLAGFQVPANQTAEASQRIADVLNKIADISSGDFADLAQGFADLAPIAKLTGLSFEETAAVLSVVIDKGYDGAESANALKSTFLSLIDPTKEASAVMKSLGIEFDSAGKPIGSVRDILIAMIPKWDQLTDSQKLNTASVIAGKEQAGKFVALLDDWKLAMERTKIANEQAGGSIEKEVTVRLQAAEVQFKSATEALRQLAVALGNELLASTGDAAGGLSELAQAFKKVIEGGALDPLLDLVRKQGDKLASLLKSIAQNLPEAFENVDFSGLIDAFSDLGDELETFFEALFGEIDLTTVEGLSSALQTVINTVEALVRTTEGIVRAFEPFAAAIGNTVQNFNELDEASKVEFGEFIGSMKAIVDVGPGIAAVLIAIGKSGIDMAEVIDKSFGIIKIGVNALQVAFDVMAAAIMAPFAAVAKALLAVAEASGTANSEFAGQLKTIIAYFDGAVENAKRNGRELAEGWTAVVGDSSTELEGLRNKLKESESSLDQFGQSVKDSGGELADWQQDVEDAADGITDAFKGINDYDLQLPELDTSSWTEATDDLDLSEPLGKSKDAMTAWKGAADAAGFGTEQYAENVKNAAAEAEKLAMEQSDLNAKTQDATNTQAGYVKTVENGVTVYRQYGTTLAGAEGAVKKVGDATKETAKDINDATKIANDFQVKMEEIASNERIKMIEFAVELNVAKLQEDTKRIEAAFDSIDKTIESTTEILGGLYDMFGSAETEWDKAKIESWIDEENERRDAALELQKKLIESQIEEVKARSRALERGDALITVKGDGLQPQLEAFMWEILKAIQVQASADMQQFLLGIA